LVIYRDSHGHALTTGAMMGLFDFFSNKKRSGVSASIQTPDNQEMESYSRIWMRDVNPAFTMQEKLANFYQLSARTNLIEIAKILSNSAPEVVEDFTLLVNEVHKFYQKHQAYCDERFEGVPQSGDILTLTAYWLTGCDTPFKYGGYIDCKDGIEDILWHLEQAIENLGYPVSLENIEWTEDELTSEALDKINMHLSKQAYTFVTLCISGDCYHLFIVPEKEYLRLYNLGYAIGFEFFYEYL